MGARERYDRMPLYKITVNNRTFTACDDHDMPSIEAAGRQGIRAALAIGAEEVGEGEAYFGAEIRVEEEGKIVGRYVVSVGASPLN